MASSQIGREFVLAWFAAFQKHCIIKDGIIPEWFHGIISRKTAEEMLMTKPPGYFLIRVSESRIGYSLSYRAEDRCRHFMIDMLPGNKYVIVGEQKEYNSLHDLVAFHRRTPIQPFSEVLTIACGQVSKDNADYAELLFPKREGSSHDTNIRPTPSGPKPQPDKHEDSRPALPARRNAPSVPTQSQNISVTPPTTSSQSARLYPCLEVELDARNLQNVVSNQQGAPPVPKPRVKHTDTPPQIPPRGSSPHNQTQASEGVVSAGCTERPLPAPLLQSEDKGSKQKTSAEAKPARISLAQCKKMFQKKKHHSEEHTYIEINENDINREPMDKRDGPDRAVKSDHQELSAEGQNHEPKQGPAPVSGTTPASLPIEYLNPPPFAPGY